MNELTETLVYVVPPLISVCLVLDCQRRVRKLHDRIDYWRTVSATNEAEIKALKRTSAK